MICMTHLIGIPILVSLIIKKGNMLLSE